MKPSPTTTTAAAAAAATTRMLSIEWNPNVAAVRHRLVPPATHFVVPDLPGIVSDRDRADFSSGMDPAQRIHTIAACHHETAESLLRTASGVDPGSKLLLVSGNNHHNRGPNTMSSVDAAKILRNEVGNDLYGVANPNDPLSAETIGTKLEAGMSGFVTQPLLSSRAADTVRAYRDHATGGATILAGMAFPKTARGLRFWAKLLGQEEELETDPRFRDHLGYFSQPDATSLAWIERELRDLLALNDGTNDDCIDGIHFMPLKNTDDLCDVFRSIDHANR